MGKTLYNQTYFTIYCYNVINFLPFRVGGSLVFSHSPLVITDLTRDICDILCFLGTIK